MSTSEASSIATTSTTTSVFSQAQPEKPFHYTYLKEFRVEQCPLFLQHKCTQHRPFTCFHWHFMNQRRRRPKKKRDGTFNYSPDVYCTQYDETSGLCPSGDDCPYLHRVAGDVERRYHLRYYKTATCIYETDSRGYCVKNGPHCAFAHGPHDLRQPVYDIRELQALEKEEANDGVQQAVENKAVVEDPRWHDTNYVLAHYKTESCKKPPRLCRQGYACPHYHNSRDRRRSPRKFRYRSTPCPQVKHGDEWGEPGNCESGDECPYCHTRTEQQFHPEIYKSTKCNDMQQTAHCPRGPFCAFAHVEQEMTTARDVEEQLNNFPPTGIQEEHDNIHQLPAYPQPIGKPGRSLSQASSTGSFSEVVGTPTSGGSFYRAPGSERSERSSSRDEDYQNFLNQVSQCGDSLLDISILLNRSTSSPSSSTPHTPTHTLSASAEQFYPADTVESVLDDLHLDDFDVTELEQDLLNEQSTSVTSSMGGSLSMPLSAPVSIPGAGHENSPTSFTPQSPLSPIGQISSSFGSGHIPLQKQMSNPYRNSPSGVRGGSLHTSILDPLVTSVPLHSPGLHSPAQLNSPLTLNPSCTDVQKLQEELMGAKTKLASWEESWAQAKQACDAWKKEAEECADKARIAQDEKEKAILKKEQSETEVSQLKSEMENFSGGPYLHVIDKVSQLDSLPLTKLKQIHQQLKTDIERLDKVIYWKQALHCQICQEQNRCIATLPCSHCVMCESCSSSQSECPYCKAKITQRTTIHIPL